MQDFSNKKSLDRVVRDLEKIGHVSRVISKFQKRELLTGVTPSDYCFP